MKSLDHASEAETAASLQAAYNRLFVPFAGFTDVDENYSLAQPYPLRYVPSVTTDTTGEVKSLTSQERP